MSAKPITDKDQIDAVNNKNKEISNPKAIKTVCLKYTKQAIKDMPQERRAEFLAEFGSTTPQVDVIGSSPNAHPTIVHPAKMSP